MTTDRTLTLPVTLEGDDALLDQMVNDDGICQRVASRTLWGETA